MALGYNAVFRQVALRVNALVGTDVSTLETNYTGGIGTAEMDSIMFPFSSIKDAILSTEEELAHIIAWNPDHPYRSYLHVVTASLAHNAVLPVASSTAVPLIGVFGACKDATSAIQCTEQDVNVIKNIVRNSGSHLTESYYYYKIFGNRILHTRTNVVLDACGYSRATQKTAIDGTGDVAGNSVLPEVLEGCLVDGTLSKLIRDEEFMGQGQVYRQSYEQGKASLAVGTVAPSAINSSNPVGA